MDQRIPDPRATDPRTIDMEAVAALIRETAMAEVMPRWRNLADHEIREKNPGDLVTDADLATERLLTAGLSAALPGSVVVGEEAVSENDSVLARLDGEAPVWIIDPVDGTSNFTKGLETFCIMVALAVRGETLAGWIYLPVSDRMIMARQGAGATLNGQAIPPNTQRAPGAMRGSVHLRYMPNAESRLMKPRLEAFASNEEIYCAGCTYVRLTLGSLDHAFFWRTKPWDHAMGALILKEAGGHTAFQDGTPYSPTVRGRTGLIAVSHGQSWGPVRDLLMA